MEDRDIIALYFSRDEQAIAQTAAKYGKLCHKIARQILRDEGETEECVNDAYLGAWNKIPPANPVSLCAFVAKIARNHALSRLKYKLAEKRNPDALVSLSELENVLPDLSAFDEIEDRELGQWISEFLWEEPEETRNIFLRKYWYFDSIEQIAEQFGYSESKIKSLLFRTRNKLKAYLTAKGVVL